MSEVRTGPDNSRPFSGQPLLFDVFVEILPKAEAEKISDPDQPRRNRAPSLLPSFICCQQLGSYNLVMGPSAGSGAPVHSCPRPSPIFPPNVIQTRRNRSYGRTPASPGFSKTPRPLLVCRDETNHPVRVYGAAKRPRHSLRRHQRFSSVPWPCRILSNPFAGGRQPKPPAHYQFF